MPESPLLAASNITKSYSGVHALSGASIQVEAGEVHALVGENGAGKSTLIKIITGATEADGGDIFFQGAPLTVTSPRACRAVGIVAIYQQPALFPELSVAENIALRLQPGRSWRRIDWKARHRRAADLLGAIGADIDTAAPASELGMAQQQMVEIAAALGAKASVLIMDEPTACLGQEDAAKLFAAVRTLRAGGAGIIYISHRLEELASLADRVTVLRDGRTIATLPMAAAPRDELIRLMVGRELSAAFAKRTARAGRLALELKGVGSRAGGVRNVDLSVHHGEILGLAGLVGAGRTALARTVFGLAPADEGEILVSGAPARITNPTQAIKLGIAYLPEDRLHHGIIPGMSISANITLASLDRLSRGVSMDFRKENQIAARFTSRLGIKARGIFAAVSELSGGNQQKVAISRWLATSPAVLILDEPTQGIDVGAKYEIHQLMVDLAAQGVAILMISSDLPEVIGMSDRVAVMRKGTIAGLLDRSEATQERILNLALGQSVKGTG